jgi:hypothetical protein
MAPKNSFELIDDYARKHHLCFLAEMFLSRSRTEYILCFRPTEAANNSDPYACRYLRLESSAIGTLEREQKLNDSIKGSLDKELSNLNSST